MSEKEPAKKMPCRDCRFCQWCSDDRCRMCLGEKKCGKKLSLQEQIELYERINKKGNEAASLQPVSSVDAEGPAVVEDGETKAR